MVVHSYYDEDPRVRREAEALVAAGREVDVIALRRPGEPSAATVAGVRVTRLGVERHQGAGIGRYAAEYLDFLVRSAVALVRAHRRRRYGLVQVHTIPDLLAAAAVPLRLAGVPLLVDFHEAMPEFFRSRFPAAANPLAHALLVLQERLAVALASEVLVVNEALEDRLIAAGVPPRKVTVVRNLAALARFDPAGHPARPFMADGTLRLVYAGALTPTYEVDVAVEAVALIRDRRPDLALRLDVYGRGDTAPALAGLAAARGVADRVHLHGRIPLEEVPAALAAADVGLAPTRRDAFTDVSLSTKIFEYAAMGKPVVATRLPMVEATCPPGSVLPYEPGDAEAMAGAILALVDDPAARAARVERTLALARERSWEAEAPRYLAVVDRLMGGTGRPVSSSG